ncbi:xylose isomerase [Paenibacillus selenitireducens]|uniref:Xylose isomerase n=1 Tax=Paenibacillus selenitireducens TaxID=1324314 RepID=A0A1T2X3A6_9BACL|nr:sugar phosphate isomerase/epimerase [Paenibacillus selenitireducens]OPA74063.1 xylose isomerase [Paenibacillus selenitireducens]
MITLTGFSDEISTDLNEQLTCLESESMRYLEFRGVWGKNVLKLNDAELAAVKEELQRREIGVSSIGSPIGKISIEDPFEPHLQDFERALHVAEYFNTRYIRVFSFFIPENNDPSRYRDEVMERMNQLVKRAEKREIILLHENEKDIFGDTSERCLDILQTVNSPSLRAAYDPANFVQCGVKPFKEAFPILKPYIEYVHIKDAIHSDGHVTVAGKGDGQVKEALAALKQEGYNGFLSLEPHLQSAGTFKGFSGAQLFKEATQACKVILDELHWDWE